MKKEKLPVNGNVNPYDAREVKSAKKAMASTKKSVKPVAKDTNKTRRKETKARITGPTVPDEKPKTNLKKDMKRPISTKGYKGQLSNWK